MKCENCNNECKEKYGSGRFCSCKCARAYSTKNITKTKIVLCNLCSNGIEVDRRSRNDIVCNNCKKIRIKKVRIKKLVSSVELVCEKCQTTFQWKNIKRFCSKKCQCSYIGSLLKKNTSKMGGLRDGGGRTKIYEYINWLNEKMKLNNDEIKVAKILDVLQVRWGRNWRGFDYIDLENNKRKYYPDFYLNDFDCYVEYKGWVTDIINHKMSDALKRNKFKLLIIYSNDKRFSMLGLNLKQIEENPNLLLKNTAVV